MPLCEQTSECSKRAYEAPSNTSEAFQDMSLISSPASSAARLYKVCVTRDYFIEGLVDSKPKSICHKIYFDTVADLH